MQLCLCGPKSPTRRCILLALAATWAITVEAASGCTTRQVSISSRGAVGSGTSPTVSSDGHLIAFLSPAGNLAPGDVTGFADIFVHDTRTRSTRLVSVNSQGEQANSNSSAPIISANGRCIAFESTANNLDARDADKQFDIYVRDLHSGTTELVSVSQQNGAANGHSREPAISSDGRYVAFQSFANNLVANDTNGKADIFVRDRMTGNTVLASLGADGSQATEVSSLAAISGNGRFVAFRTPSPGLVPGDQDLGHDYFVRDLIGAATERISEIPNQPELFNLGGYSAPALSEDGRFVAFHSTARFSPSDTDGYYDVYVRDRSLNTVERISAPLSGGVADNNSSDPTISSDGRFVAFYSGAGNLVGLPPDNRTHVFVRDREWDVTELVSLTAAGQREHGEVLEGRISGDGGSVAFVSTRFTRPGDLPRPQVYLRTRGNRTTTPRARLVIRGSTHFPTTRPGNLRSRDLVLQNRGSETLHGSVGTLSGPFRIASGGGYFIIPRGGAHRVTVTFEPQAEGRFSSDLTVNVDGNPSTSRILRFKGTGR